MTTPEMEGMDCSTLSQARQPIMLAAEAAENSQLLAISEQAAKAAAALAALHRLAQIQLPEQRTLAEAAAEAREAVA